jgi:hypothetical protein
MAKIPGRVISLKIQAGNTSQRNKWANTDPRIYRRWDQVPRRSKHPLLIDHTCRYNEQSLRDQIIKLNGPDTIMTCY